MTEPEYKLDMELAVDSEAPQGLAICVLCGTLIQGGYYTLSVTTAQKVIYFDFNCFNQLLAIGYKLYLQIQSESTERHN